MAAAAQFLSLSASTVRPLSFLSSHALTAPAVKHLFPRPTLTPRSERRHSLGRVRARSFVVGLAGWVIARSSVVASIDGSYRS